jgi:putative DNA primase/helicase
MVSIALKRSERNRCRSSRNWQAFEAELHVRIQEIVAELLGNPTFRAGQEWRWGRKGSLSVVIGGARGGMWFDHEGGDGGRLVDLVAREKVFSWIDGPDWTAERIGMGTRHSSGRSFKVPANNVETKAAKIDLRSQADEVPDNQTSGGSADPAALRAPDPLLHDRRSGQRLDGCCGPSWQLSGRGVVADRPGP